MSKRGRKPNLERRRRAVALYRRGFTMPEIGRRLRTSKQAVQAMLQAVGIDTGSAGAACAACRAPLSSRAAGQYGERVLCLACLDRLPRATLGQRLRAYRVAAELTRLELAERAGVSISVIGNCERGQHKPSWKSLGKLVKVLGVGLIVPGGSP
jgi:DNA-binding XRE family transcriptional regulator